MTYGLLSANQQRFNEADDLYGYANWALSGAPDMIKGTFANDRPLSFDHWMNSFGTAGLALGGYSSVKTVFPPKPVSHQYSYALESANFAQKTYNNKFSNYGITKYSNISGYPITTVDDLTNALISGNVVPSSVPIEYIVRDANPLILNTRSANALINANIPRYQWSTINRTGLTLQEKLLTDQLNRNKLTSYGIESVKRSGN